MRILYVVHQFFPRYYAGTERFTFNLARQMSRLGHLPLVMTYERDTSGEEGFRAIHKDVLVKRYSYQTISVISLAHARKRTFYEMSDSSIEEAFNKLNINCDIVHVCHPMWLSTIAKACKRIKIPLVLTVTDPWLLCPRALIDVRFKLCDGPEQGEKCVTNCKYDRKIIERYQDALSLFNMADEITTSSKFTASLFRRNGWKRRIRIVSHSIDYSYVKRTQKIGQATISFGFIGSISWHKGLHVLLNAFRMVKSPNVRLIIYGSLRDDPEYVNMIIQLAKGDERIQFRGPFDMADSSEIMNDISVLVVPSVYYENYPLVTLMALAYKIPVIGSDIGGISEAIQDGKNGFLVKPGRKSELGSLIERIAANPEILQDLKENIVSPRRIEQEALDYENIYRKLTTEAAPLTRANHKSI
jgi:glycosyltransferase involved in cell wall biosynthesis